MKKKVKIMLFKSLIVIMIVIMILLVVWFLISNGKIREYKDENGNIIYETKSRGIEGSLVEILFGENATQEQREQVRRLMVKSGLTHTVDSSNPYDAESWYWNDTNGTVAYKLLRDPTFVEGIDVNALNMGSRLVLVVLLICSLIWVWEKMYTMVL